MELLQVKGKFDYFEIPKGIKYIAPDAFFYSEVNTLKMNKLGLNIDCEIKFLD